MKFVSSRDIVVRSKSTGHAVEFKKGVPTLAPVGMHEELFERGVLPADQSGAAALDLAGATVDAATPKVLLAPDDGNERSMKIVEVFKAMVKRNSATDFTAGGTPNAAAVTSALGWRVDQKEVRAAWEKNREKLLNRNQSE